MRYLYVIRLNWLQPLVQLSIVKLKQWQQWRTSRFALVNRKYVMKPQGSLAHSVSFCRKTTIGQIGVALFAFALFVLAKRQFEPARIEQANIKRVKILAGSEQPIQRFGEKALSLIRWVPVGWLRGWLLVCTLAASC